ncbi:hypothetical protein VE23_07950 [Paenibacillus sp. D9]|uniref:hypothetical protein n=1 Tax=Paenibacillus humicus TaxID=412861 RepID=UPI00061FC3C4|nr:hypothetical protein [Paenibacillus humicus]KKC47094.1 hypothetical protein VE23_07950 [Paenibacillus sp. D9]
MYGKQRQAEEGFVGDGEAFLCLVAVPEEEALFHFFGSNSRIWTHGHCSSRKALRQIGGAALA